MNQDQFNTVLSKIDALNAEDPNRDMSGGKSHPRELLYSQRLTDWVLKLAPQASEELRIAARGQHVCRWKVPREQYEMNRQGYLRWREGLKKFHAETVAGLMRDAGYEEAGIQKVKTLILKKDLKNDLETQILEDGLCLVFLETQFADLIAKTPAEKMTVIVQKTWQKMSAQGKAAALTLSMGQAEKDMLVKSGILS